MTPTKLTTSTALASGVAAGVLLGRASASPQARFARMTGSSIARPDAAGWMTDFLNAAYFRRTPDVSGVDDLRLASAIVTTYWRCGGGRRLRAADVGAFHKAFGRDRFLEAGRSPRGTLNREQLLEGAARLFGPWFPDAYADPARRGWGIAFATVEEKAAYRPEQRLELARVGALTPGVRPGSEQTWHTYPPVAMPPAEQVIAALTEPETWPDYASEIGRFTPLRSTGLLGQTFEIEVAAGTAAGRPIFTRGYVTITRLVTPDDPVALQAYVDELEDGLARFGYDEPRALPEGAEPIAAFDLTTHEHHFMGSGNNRLLLFSHEGGTWVRAAGTWDPLPWHLEEAYQRAGRDAQHAFWGQGSLDRQSMLHQLALQIA